MEIFKDTNTEKNKEFEKLLNNQISKIAQQNRLILLGIMTQAGWDFYRNEWWHYQLFNTQKYPLISDTEIPEPMMLRT